MIQRLTATHACTASRQLITICWRRSSSRYAAPSHTSPSSSVLPSTAASDWWEPRTFARSTTPLTCQLPEQVRVNQIFRGKSKDWDTFYNDELWIVTTAALYNPWRGSSFARTNSTATYCARHVARSRHEGSCSPDCFLAPNKFRPIWKKIDFISD